MKNLFLLIFLLISFVSLGQRTFPDTTKLKALTMVNEGSIAFITEGDYIGTYRFTYDELTPNASTIFAGQHNGYWEKITTSLSDVRETVSDSIIQKADTTVVNKRVRMASDSTEIKDTYAETGNIYLTSNGDIYRVWDTEIGGFTTDGRVVIPVLGSKYARLEGANKVYRLSTFGAVGDDGISDRDAIEKALDYVHTYGGGTVLNDVGQLYVDTTDASIDIDYIKNVTLDLNNDTIYFQPYNGVGSFKTFLNITQAVNFKIQNGNFRSNGIYDGWRFQQTGTASNEVHNTSNWLPIDIGNTNQRYGDPTRSKNVKLLNLTFDSLHYNYWLIADNSVIDNIQSNYVPWGHWHFWCENLSVTNTYDKIDSTVVAPTNTNHHAFYISHPRGSNYQDIVIEGDSLKFGWESPISVIGHDITRGKWLPKSSINFDRVSIKFCGTSLFGVVKASLDNYEIKYPRYGLAAFRLTQDSVRLSVGDLYVELDLLDLRNDGVPRKFDLFNIISSVDPAFPVNVNKIHTVGNIGQGGALQVGQSIIVNAGSYVCEDPDKFDLTSANDVIDFGGATVGNFELNINNFKGIVNEVPQSPAFRFFDWRYANDLNISNLQITNNSGAELDGIFVIGQNSSGSINVDGGNLLNANYADLVIQSAGYDSSTVNINVLNDNGVNENYGGIVTQINNLQDLSGTDYSLGDHFNGEFYSLNNNPFNDVGEGIVSNQGTGSRYLRAYSVDGGESTLGLRNTTSWARIRAIGDQMRIGFTSNDDFIELDESSSNVTLTVDAVFQGTTSGIDYGDLDNTPSVYTKTQVDSIKQFVVDSLNTTIDNQATTRDILISDIDKVIRATDTITLNLTTTLDNGMEIGDAVIIMNATTDGTPVTVQAPAGITLDGTDAGSTSFDTSGSSRKAKTLFKIGAASYEIY